MTSWIRVDKRCYFTYICGGPFFFLILSCFAPIHDDWFVGQHTSRRLDRVFAFIADSME